VTRTTVDRIRAGLLSHRPERVVEPGEHTLAAVAAIARDTGDGAELLFIRRAERDGDPWSGHVAFPGGRAEPRDADAQAAAVRETLEEIGLDLGTSARPLGELADVLARPSLTRMALPMIVRPFVYELTSPSPALSLSDEVREVLWLPLAFLLDPRNRHSMPWRMGELTIQLPCYRFGEHVLWGMTLRMVDELLELLPPAAERP
jgi:8-oxo-dGTP pyrophosphatase MutT (NUDIX family)